MSATVDPVVVLLALALAGRVELNAAPSDRSAGGFSSKARASDAPRAQGATVRPSRPTNRKG